MKDWINNWKIQEIDQDNVDYPSNLKKIKNPPLKLYYRGKWRAEMFDKVAAVIGSRRMTRYGKDVCEMMVRQLVGENINIVSGFMYGVDTEAHQLTIEYGGLTLAVLGGGLDYLYPTENEDLYKKILESGGLIISEYKALIKPTLWTFPQRNRIVSGLTNKGVYIVEAGENSGSLVTANLARNQGKEIWAAPGMITSKLSAGTNKLIKDGWAKMYLGEMKENTQLNLFENLSSSERNILQALETENQTVDELVKKFDMSVQEITVILSQLCVKGVVKEVCGAFELKR